MLSSSSTIQNVNSNSTQREVYFGGICSSISSGAAALTLTEYSDTTICCTVWSNDELRVAMGASDGSVSVWEAATGLQLAALKCSCDAAVNVITWSPDCRLLAVVVDASPAGVCVFDVNSSMLLATYTLRGLATLMRWSADGCVLQDAQGDLCSSIKDLYIKHLSILTQHAFAATQGSAEQKAAAVKILQLKGLVRKHGVLVSGAVGPESLIYSAGWALEDSEILAMAAASNICDSLVQAAAYGNAVLVELLIGAGADVNKEGRCFDPRDGIFFSACTVTPLEAAIVFSSEADAVVSRHAAVISLLINAKANVSSKFMIATAKEFSCGSMLATLLAADVKERQRITFDGLWSEVTMDIEHNWRDLGFSDDGSGYQVGSEVNLPKLRFYPNIQISPACIASLVEHADVHIRNSDGAMPLFLLVKPDSDIIAWSATILERRHQQKSSYLQTVEGILKCLVSHGADVNIQDESGHFPLHGILGFTTKLDSQWMIKHYYYFKWTHIFLDAGLRTDIRDSNGENALDLMLKNWDYISRSDLRELLIKAGAMNRVPPVFRIFNLLSQTRNDGVAAAEVAELCKRDAGFLNTVQ